MSLRLDAQDEKYLADRARRNRERRTNRSAVHAHLRQLRASTSELEARAVSLERQSEDHLRACEQLVIQLGGE